MLIQLFVAAAISSSASGVSLDPDFDRVLLNCGVRTGAYKFAQEEDEVVAIMHSPSDELSDGAMKCLVKNSREGYRVYRFDSPQAEKRFDYAAADFDAKPEHSETADQALQRVQRTRTLLDIKWSGASTAAKARRVEAFAGYPPGQALTSEDGMVWVRLDRLPEHTTYRRFMELMQFVQIALPGTKVRVTASRGGPSLNRAPAP